MFTDHLAKFAQFADLKVVRPLDGHRYGAPKDWDTISIFYDRAALKAAGVAGSQLQNLTWNPQDGGTLEKLVAHLTIDTKGVRGDQPGFDKNHIKIHGLSAEGHRSPARSRTRPPSCSRSPATPPTSPR